MSICIYMYKHTHIINFGELHAGVMKLYKGKHKKGKAKIGSENHMFRCKLKSRSELSFCLLSL